MRPWPFLLLSLSLVSGCRSGVFVELCAPGQCGDGGGADLTDLQPSTDLSLPDLSMADLPLPDLSLPDLSLPDLSLPDLSLPDLATPDLARPDLSLPDLALPDLSLPDLALPDLARPDLARPDLSLPDLNMPDMAFPPACTSGKDPWTMSGWVICAADFNVAWLPPAAVYDRPSLRTMDGCRRGAGEVGVKTSSSRLCVPPCLN